MPDGKHLAVIDDERTIRLLNLESGSSTRVLQQSDSLLTAKLLRCFPDGQRVAAASANTILVWDVEAGKLERTLKEGSEYRDLDLSWTLQSPDGVQIASCGKDRTVRLWDVQSGSCTHILRGYSSRVATVSFSPSGQLVASGSWDGTV